MRVSIIEMLITIINKNKLLNLDSQWSEKYVYYKFYNVLGILLGFFFMTYIRYQVEEFFGS